MFSQLRIKLTVLYAALFCTALLFISATAYAVVASNAQRLVREQLQATGAVFDSLWQVRFGQLQEGAQLSAQDYGFRQAVATQDTATIRSALQNLRRRLNADLVFLVTPDGRVLNADETQAAASSPSLEAALEADDALTGVLMSRGVLHQSVTAPIFAPNLLGWVVVAERLDKAEMRALERLSPIPLHAVALSRGPDGWGAGDETLDPHDRQIVGGFIDRALRSAHPQPGSMDAYGGRAIALVKPLRALDGTSSVLLLRYPLARAMAPFRALFSTLFAIGLAGLSLLVIATWLLANGITQPISTLEAAARRLEAGEYDPVTVRTKDEISRLAESFNAMAASIRERERCITDLALHDSETGLPNRLALERRITASTPAGARVFLAAIGIDRFALVRGAIGYAHASALVAQLGQRLGELAQGAPMGRLSTDVLGLAFLADDENAATRRMRTLQAKLAQPVLLEGQVVDLDLSIGVASAKTEDESPSALIDRASIALDQARSLRAPIGFFDAASYGDPARNLSLMGEMRRALAHGHIHLVHQPKLTLRSNVIEGVETLVRWRHPTRGMIAPDLFVPMAEETGHIRALTDWVLRRAVVEQRAVAKAGWPLAFSINISGRLLSDRDFALNAVSAVAGAANAMCFEITETAVIDNPKVALENIDLFARNGIGVSIDDFGSGLSSLAYLKQLPARELKIDKVFVQNLTNSQRDALLVRSTIDLAHGLGMKVTAEGVENPTCFALLSAMGCDMAQGYLVSRPEPMNELLTILNDARRMEFFQQAARHGVQSAAS